MYGAIYLLNPAGSSDILQFFLSTSGAYISMHSSSKSCLGYEKLKKYDNSFICSILFATLYILQVLQRLNVVYEKSNECKQLLDFPLLYELPCHFYCQKQQQPHHNLALYNHLCLALTLKLLSIMFHLMLFQISLIYSARNLKIPLVHQIFYQQTSEEVTIVLCLTCLMPRKL